MKNKKIFLIIGLVTTIFSCSLEQITSGYIFKKSDPYSPESKRIEEIIDRTIQDSKEGTTRNVTDNTQIVTAKVVETKINEAEKNVTVLNNVKVQESSTKQVSTSTVNKSTVNNEKKTATIQGTNNLQSSKTNIGGSKIDDKFDETDIKIVDFIAEKVTENSSKIKELTILGVTQLKNQKNISISKREFLARTYQVMKENNINSYAVASKKMMSTLSK